MTIPNVTFRWCGKQATCKWCEQQIEVAQPMVVVFFWNKGADGRRWNVQQCYHPECWLKQGYDYLDMNPYVAPVRSRPRLELNDKDKQQRYLLTRRYHSCIQRLNRLDNGSEPLRVLELECQMADLMLEMRKVGGVPKKWLERL